MIAYSIEELHTLLLDRHLQPSSYYAELFQEAYFQQQRLNAFVSIMPQDVLIQDRQYDFSKVLSGIPMVLKDNFCTDHVFTTASSRFLKHYQPPYLAHVVERLKQENFVLLGKTSMDELGMGANNLTAFSGPVKNPWDSSRIAGGSSGGSAALVGSGLVPYALGSDTGDSIRRPASFCGVIGFKPTWGRISRYGLIPYAASLDTVGILTRNVRDTAIVTEAIAGFDERDMTSSQRMVPHYLQHLSDDLSSLKIAVLKNVYDTIKDSSVAKPFEEVIALCQTLHAQIEEVSLPQVLLDSLSGVYHVIANGEATSHHACFQGINFGERSEGHTLEDIMIHSRSDGFSSAVKRRLLLGYWALSDEHQEEVFQKAQKIRRLIVEEMQKIYCDYDIILMPHTQVAPLLQEALLHKTAFDFQNTDNHLCLANLIGAPSLSLPCGFIDHMPISVNLTGRLFEEQTLFNVAYALEKRLGFQNQYSRVDPSWH